MTNMRFYQCCLAAALCLSYASATSEKQIKLEDIEKDNLKAAQQAKYEKQLQQQQYAQQPFVQQASLQYEPQVYAQQGVAYHQTPATYSQYLVPQQYYPQTVLSGYGHLAGNSLDAGYAAPSAHAFQAYVSPQVAGIPSVPSFHSAQPIAAATQTQPLLMTFAAPQIATFQQQPYYQGALQYYPAQTGQTAQFYYTPQAADHAATSQVSSNVVYPAAQQYLNTYQPIATTKTTSGFAQQYVSTAPQTFPAQSYSNQQDFSSVYTPQTYSTSSQTYANVNTERPTFVTVKVPQHLVATQGQQQQFNRAQPQQTTISPLQAKYLNSPQYLAQNYNTIQSSLLYPKASLSSGIKSTVSPPVKVSPAATSFSSSNSASSYVPFRNLPGKTY